MASGHFVSYVRVSTKDQGRSGLGVEAQKETVRQFLNGGNWQLVGEFEEHESGKRNDRPKLRAALDMCKMKGATLIIARLDRMSRNAAFITALMDSKVKFLCCDMPTANEFTITVMAALAQQERANISRNTKAALAAAKARGVELGNVRNATPEGRLKGNLNSAKARQQIAADRKEALKGVVASMYQTEGSFQKVADRLNREHYEAPRVGCSWHANTVKRLLD